MTAEPATGWGACRPTPVSGFPDTSLGEAIPAAVSVPSHVHHDPQPAAGGCPQGGGHDEEELLRISIPQGQQGEEDKSTNLVAGQVKPEWKVVGNQRPAVFR